MSRTLPSQYARKRKRPPPFSRPLVTGGATHRLIAEVLPDFMQTGEIPADIESRALREVSTTEYLADELPYREQDAASVAECTAAAFEMIPPGSSSLLQERNLYAPLGRSGVQVGARIDLVLSHANGEIEHIDFKTGKIRDDVVQTLIARAVVGNRFGNTRRIRTTTLYLQHRERRTKALDRASSGTDWRAIARDIRDIRLLDSFPPSPGPLCDYCPYQARDCSAWRPNAGNQRGEKPVTRLRQ